MKLPVAAFYIFLPITCLALQRHSEGEKRSKQGGLQLPNTIHPQLYTGAPPFPQQPAAQQAAAAPQAKKKPQLVNKPRPRPKLKPQQLAPAQTEPTNGWNSFTFSIFLIIGFVCLLLGIVFAFVYMYREYRKVKSSATDKSAVGLASYFQYRFGYWISWNPYAKLFVLVGILCSLIAVGGVALRVMTNYSLKDAMYRVFVWILDPDGGMEEDHPHKRTVGAITSILGLLLFAVILFVVQDGFNTYIGLLQKGRAPVLESGHTVIVGFDGQFTMRLIKELAKAMLESGGTTFVILAEQEKQEVEKELQHAIWHRHLDLKNSFVVVRQGRASSRYDLEKVSMEMARACIIIPHQTESPETRDAILFRSLISICSAGWPRDGRIMAVCALPRNRDLVVKIAGKKVDIITPDTFLSQLILHCSHDPGVGSILEEIMSFSEGSELYIDYADEKLYGKSISAARSFYPEATVLGVMKDSPEDYTLCPRADYELEPDDRLIFFAQDESSCFASTDSIMPASPPSRRMSRSSSKMSGTLSLGLEYSKHATIKETVFIFGWNNSTPTFLLDLDKQVGPKSAVVLYSPKPEQEQRQLMTQWQERRGYKIKNIGKFHHESGPLGSRYRLQFLPVHIKHASRIFIFADESASDHEHVDSLTITTALQVSAEIKGEHGRYVPIVLEISHHASERLCRDANLRNFVNTKGIFAQFVACVYNQPLLGSVLFDMIAPGGEADIFLRNLKDYLPAKSNNVDALSYHEASQIVQKSGDVLLGWTIPDESSVRQGSKRPRLSESLEELTGSQRQPDVSLDPVEKATRRHWSMEDDKLIVLGMNV
jgi:hypothetical protein